MMSRKDYVRIAHIIADVRCNGDAATADTIAMRMATVMAQDNPRFDRGRFLAACGLPA